MSEVVVMKEVIHVDRRKSQIRMNDGKWVTYRKLFKFQGRDWAILEGNDYWTVCMPTTSSGQYVQITMIPSAGIAAIAEILEGRD